MFLSVEVGHINLISIGFTRMLISPQQRVDFLGRDVCRGLIFRRGVVSETRVSGTFLPSQRSERNLCLAGGSETASGRNATGTPSCTEECRANQQQGSQEWLFCILHSFQIASIPPVWISTRDLPTWSILENSPFEWFTERCNRRLHPTSLYM